MKSGPLPFLIPLALRVSQFIDRSHQILGRCTAWLCIVMIAVGSWNVVGRYVGRALGENLTSNVLIETQWYLFDLIFLLGGAYALQCNDFVRVDLLYSHFNTRQKAIANLVGTLLFQIPFCILILIYSWQFVSFSWATWEVSPDPDGLPVYPIKTMILVGFTTMLLQGISEVLKNLLILTGHLTPQDNSYGSEL